MYPPSGFSSKVRQFLHTNGVRATLARIKIFSELTTTQDSVFSDDDIYRSMQLKNEIIALSTVHKTLKQLCQFGLLAEDYSNRRNLFFKKTDNFSKFQPLSELQ